MPEVGIPADQPGTTRARTALMRAEKRGLLTYRGVFDPRRADDMRRLAALVGDDGPRPEPTAGGFHFLVYLRTGDVAETWVPLLWPEDAVMPTVKALGLRDLGVDEAREFDYETWALGR